MMECLWFSRCCVELTVLLALTLTLTITRLIDILLFCGLFTENTETQNEERMVRTFQLWRGGSARYEVDGSGSCWCNEWVHMTFYFRIWTWWVCNSVSVLSSHSTSSDATHLKIIKSIETQKEGRRTKQASDQNMPIIVWWWFSSHIRNCVIIVHSVAVVCDYATIQIFD